MDPDAESRARLRALRGESEPQPIDGAADGDREDRPSKPRAKKPKFRTAQANALLCCAVKRCAMMCCVCIA